jgi:ATP-dependent phosphoenolpyruvate carboxykinase
VTTKLLKKFGIEVPEYAPDQDPTKRGDSLDPDNLWTTNSDNVKNMEKLYDKKLKSFPKKRSSVGDDKDSVKNVKMKKEPIKKEEI